MGTYRNVGRVLDAIKDNGLIGDAAVITFVTQQYRITFDEAEVAYDKAKELGLINSGEDVIRLKPKGKEFEKTLLGVRWQLVIEFLNRTKEFFAVLIAVLIRIAGIIEKLT